MLFDGHIPVSTSKAKRTLAQKKKLHRETLFASPLDIGLAGSKRICENFVP